MTESLIGIYDADGTFVGEIAYWLGARLGRRHCALCDITHGLFSEKAEWRECRTELETPIELVHRDEMTPEMREASEGRLPCVLVEKEDGSFEIGLGPEDLERYEGNPKTLAASLSRLISQN